MVTINLEPKQLLKIKVILLRPKKETQACSLDVLIILQYFQGVFFVCVVSVWGSLQRAVSELVTQPDVDGEGMGLFPSHICLFLVFLSDLISRLPSRPENQNTKQAEDIAQLAEGSLVLHVQGPEFHPVHPINRYGGVFL